MSFMQCAKNYSFILGNTNILHETTKYMDQIRSNGSIEFSRVECADVYILKALLIIRDMAKFDKGRGKEVLCQIFHIHCAFLIKN